MSKIALQSITRNGWLRLLNQWPNPVAYALRVGKENAPLNPHNQQSGPGFNIRVLWQERPEDVRVALASYCIHWQAVSLLSKSKHRGYDGY